MIAAGADRFVASAVHELQGPLARLRAVAEEGASGSTDAHQALLRAQLAAVDASQTIDDMVELAQLVVGGARLPLQPVRLDALVESLIVGRPQLGAMQLDLEPTWVEGRVALLRRAVSNLVENAWQHGGQNGCRPTVLVTVRPSQVTVSDSGPGMEPDRLARVFAAASCQGPDESAGLGLRIAGWVMRLHEGSLWAENRSGGGLAVHLSFPLHTRGDALHHNFIFDLSS